MLVTNQEEASGTVIGPSKFAAAVSTVTTALPVPGNSGSVDRKLGETLNITGGLTAAMQQQPKRWQTKA
ncbi:hypothetical protein [Acinetobacter nosocomialis]|uniref:hypothetical protein n=1 Tax=Acinetobacter nosocomialis TaxID=106654 RepID=UPI001ADCBC6E|nr:hypothetical protein [Acinetobacter nosocomialis]MBO8216325.1 hypothetical protein [Acinetobacter nosocomialis]